MKALLLVALMAVATPSLAAELVFCFRDATGDPVLFKAQVADSVDADFLQEDLRSAGISDDAMDRLTLVVDLESESIVLDRREQSKIHKAVPAEKLKAFRAMLTTDVSDVNDYAELLGS